MIRDLTLPPGQLEGLSPKESEQYVALQVYNLNRRNLSAVERSEAVHVSRVTLGKWKKKGAPAVVTGGLAWDTYLDQLPLKGGDGMSEEAARALADSGDFFGDARTKLVKLFNDGVGRVTADGFRWQARDFADILRAIQMISKDEDERQAYKETVFNLFMGVAEDLLDPTLFQTFQQKLVNAAQDLD